jgi:hypothetical protein
MKQDHAIVKREELLAGHRRAVRCALDTLLEVLGSKGAVAKATRRKSSTLKRAWSQPHRSLPRTLEAIADVYVRVVAAPPAGNSADLQSCSATTTTGIPAVVETGPARVTCLTAARQQRRRVVSRPCPDDPPKGTAA